VEKAIDALRQQQVSFKTVERPAQTGDIAVVNYTGTSDGKPITDITPTAKGLTEQKNFWVEMESKSFIPGFADQLTGAKAGDKRTVNIDFPADFVTPQLQGKKGVYEVEVVEVKEKVLPTVDDAFAKTFGAEDAQKLREGVHRDLENELTYSQNRAVRNQLIEALMKKVNFELPESAVENKTRNLVYDLVRENQKRGVPREMIEQEKDRIYSAAAQNAKDHVKVAFLLRKIAEKEDIKVSQEEVLQRIQAMSQMYQIPPEKFIKDLQKRNGIVEIYDQLASEKTVEFLQQNAKIEEVPAGTLSKAEGAPAA
jgi:trigger factor